MIVKASVHSLVIAAMALSSWLSAGAAGEPKSPPAGARSPSTVAQASQSPAAPVPVAERVGDDVCAGCHEAEGRGYLASVHGRPWRANSPGSQQGCESCHGPGRDHVEAAGDKTKIKTLKAGLKAGTKAREINAICLSCHVKAEHALWEGSPHDARHLSCASCHSIHAPKSERGLINAARQIETCERCHRAQVLKLSRSSHMPVEEGRLECSSCHNPHGSTNTKLLTAGNTINESCESCHANKRGPYLWEHAPVVQDCTTCHDAHGSTNDRMLVAKQPMLCQRCHVTAQHPATAYDGYQLAFSTSANRVYGRSCAACHQNIHGSNAPSGKAFLR